MKKIILYIILIMACVLTACRDERINNDPSLRLSLSVDTLRFDTVFSGIGTATMQVMLRNPNANAMRIDRIWQDSTGDNRFFFLNVSGETDLRRLDGMTLRGGDSLYIFARVNVDPARNPLILEDALHFAANEHVTTLRIEAYGQDVNLIRSARHRTDTTNFTFTAERPYLIFDTLHLGGTTTMEAGAKLYFHYGTGLIIDGDWNAIGSESQPITLIGDRIDRLFEHVPYAYCAGGWSGVTVSKGATCQLTHTRILSAENGIWADSAQSILLNHCCIHNHSQHALALNGCNQVKIDYCEISNAAAYLLYLAGPGTCTADHTTFASYFNHTGVRIQNVPKQNVSAILLDTIAGVGPTVQIHNSITAGWNGRIDVADTLRYPSISYSYLDCDTIRQGDVHDNVYWQRGDTIFRNDYFEYKVYNYYDFHLADRSPARGIDERGENAGCYSE